MQTFRRCSAVNPNLLILVLVLGCVAAIVSLEEFGGFRTSAHPIAFSTVALLAGFCCALLRWTQRRSQ